MPEAASLDSGIAVVIATIGRAGALRVCLDSLAKQTMRPAEIVVVHSGSDPETRALCEEDWASRGLHVEYFAYPHKSAALQRDFAVRRTRQPLIMFADDDMEFERDWVEQLLRELIKEPGIGATMGRIMNQTIAVPTALWRFYRRLVASAARGFVPGAVIGALVPNGFPEDAAAPIPAEWVGGCITLLRKDAYLSVNGFAPHFRGSSPGEDVDLGYRISRRWKVYYVPSARCLHHQSRSGRENIGRHQYLSMRSRFAFCRASAGMGTLRSLWHITLWALFQTASELSQIRRGRLRRDFLAAIGGRIRGAWSCAGWDPTAEQFPEWHDTHVA
ncbi:MAG: glycosyltransferase [Cyanobacteria bacterium]|nr:glycosyltransferase [Cyanobacteriota bacterium]